MGGGHWGCWHGGGGMRSVEDLGVTRTPFVAERRLYEGTSWKKWEKDDMQTPYTHRDPGRL
jgi:hypothetical protein